MVLQDGTTEGGARAANKRTKRKVGGKKRGKKRGRTDADRLAAAHEQLGCARSGFQDHPTRVAQRKKGRTVPEWHLAGVAQQRAAAARSGGGAALARRQSSTSVVVWTASDEPPAAPPSGFEGLSLLASTAEYMEEWDEWHPPLTDQAALGEYESLARQADVEERARERASTLTSIKFRRQRQREQFQRKLAQQAEYDEAAATAGAATSARLPQQVLHVSSTVSAASTGADRVAGSAGSESFAAGAGGEGESSAPAGGQGNSGPPAVPTRDVFNRASGLQALLLFPGAAIPARLSTRYTCPSSGCKRTFTRRQPLLQHLAGSGAEGGSPCASRSVHVVTVAAKTPGGKVALKSCTVQHKHA